MRYDALARVELAIQGAVEAIKAAHDQAGDDGDTGTKSDLVAVWKHLLAARDGLRDVRPYCKSIRRD